MKKNQFTITLKATAAFILLFTLIIGVANADTYKRQSNKKNSVRVDVLPLQLVTGKPMTFDIRMNSHSVNLNSDIVAGSSITDEAGNTYNALKWNGTKPGSHHRSGTLEFPTLKKTPGKITLTIKGIANVPQRNFKWKVH